MIRLVVVALLLALVGNAQPAPVERVNASDYDAFWLWAGVKPQPVLSHARRLYLLQGQVEAGPAVRLVAQRPAIPHVTGPRSVDGDPGGDAGLDAVGLLESLLREIAQTLVNVRRAEGSHEQDNG